MSNGKATFSHKYCRPWTTLVEGFFLLSSAWQINFIILWITVLYSNNYPYYLNGNQRIDLFVVSIITIVTGIYDALTRFLATAFPRDSSKIQRDYKNLMALQSIQKWSMSDHCYLVFCLTINLFIYCYITLYSSPVALFIIQINPSKIEFPLHQNFYHDIYREIKLSLQKCCKITLGLIHKNNLWIEVSVAPMQDGE